MGVRAWAGHRPRVGEVEQGFHQGGQFRLLGRRPYRRRGPTFALPLQPVIPVATVALWLFRFVRREVRYMLLYLVLYGGWCCLSYWHLIGPVQVPSVTPVRNQQAQPFAAVTTIICVRYKTHKPFFHSFC